MIGCEQGPRRFCFWTESWLAMLPDKDFKRANGDFFFFLFLDFCELQVPFFCCFVFGSFSSAFTPDLEYPLF